MMGEDEETTMPPMTLVFSPGAKANFAAVAWPSPTVMQPRNCPQGSR